MPSLGQTASKRQFLVRRARKGVAQTQWFIDEVSDHVNITLRQRMGTAIGFLKNKIILNIRIPVRRIVGPRGGVQVIRSKPGEFPRADTVELMRTLITDVTSITPAIVDGSVGSPKDYSVFLELNLNRSFLRRTLLEERETIKNILVGQSITIG